METLSALLALCEGNALVTDDSSPQRPVMHRFNALVVELQRWFQKRSCDVALMWPPFCVAFFVFFFLCFKYINKYVLIVLIYLSQMHRIAYAYTHTHTHTDTHTHTQAGVWKQNKSAQRLNLRAQCWVYNNNCNFRIFSYCWWFRNIIADKMTPFNIIDKIGPMRVWLALLWGSE